MQTCSQTFKAGAAPRACRSSPGPLAVRCQQQQGLPRAVQEAAKTAALATVAASLILGLGLPAEAAKKKPSYYEKRDAYEKELKASLQVRGGEMPSVKASPPGLYVGERKMKPLDFSDLKKTTREPTKGLPTALPTRD